jgi:tripartite-type tricarboxylate transporter receptor subunit TctC
MKSNLLSKLLICMVMSLTLLHANAQNHFPEKPVKIIVPFGVGGLADITFRIYAEKLTTLTNKQFIIENMPGSGGFAAANALLRAKPDGYTLMVMTNGTAISKSLYKTLPYDPAKDLQAISFAGDFDLIVVANSEERFKTFQQLMSQAKNSTKGINIGTINPGSTQNLAAELFKSVTKINAQIIPFKSTPEALNALMSAEIDIVFETFATTKSLIQSGKLLPLASSASQRSEYLPKVPTIMESGYENYDVVGWNALVAPVGTPVEVLNTLNHLMNQAAENTDVKQKLNALGSKAHAGSISELQKRFSDDLLKWANIIKQSSIEIQ